jgi:hypothetical protein
VMKLVDRVGVSVMRSFAAQMRMFDGEFRMFVRHDVGILGRPERASEQDAAK